MKENLHIKRLISSTCTAYITNISQEDFTRLYIDHGRIHLYQFIDLSAKTFTILQYYNKIIL